MAQETRIAVDISKIRTAIQAELPLVITTYTLPHEMEDYMANVLLVFLREVNQPQMSESLAYCLKELVNNAKKANTKRVYFLEKGLDINNPQDYEEGMKHFKNDTVNNINHYLEKQKEQGLYIKVILQAKNDLVLVEVRNKASLTVFEFKRIHDKITRAQQYESIEEGIAQLLDDSEGAGLGLVIMFLVLKRIGLTEENYQVLSENGETITRMLLPFDDKTKRNITTISVEFVRLINGLPEFPENITEINAIINNPESKMSEIATKISNDVSLTAELLKMVNSAAFALATPCHSIGEAVKMAGLRGIRNILFSIGAITVLDANGQKKQLWEHSFKVAFYSYNLARSFCRSAQERNIIEDSYVCGLLHDMGKIIFETAHPDLLKRIYTICEQRGITPDLFERTVAGVNHGEVGARIAQKWNFPEVIVNVIRYHHAPKEAPQQVQRLTSIVYLADLFAHYQEGTVDFSQFDTSILSDFSIKDEADVQNISAKLSAAFEVQKNGAHT